MQAVELTCLSISQANERSCTFSMCPYVLVISWFFDPLVCLVLLFAGTDQIVMVPAAGKRWIPSWQPKSYLMEPIGQTFKTIRSPTSYPLVIGATLTSLNGHVYCIGGAPADDLDMDTVLCGTHVKVYVPNTDLWFSCPSLPSPLGQHTAVAMDRAGLLITLGGRTRGAAAVPPGVLEPPTDKIFCYDSRERSWQQNPGNCRLPKPLHALAAAAVDEYTILALGGKNKAAADAAAADAAAAVAAPPLPGAAAVAPEQAAAQVAAAIAGVSLTPQLLDIRTWRWRPCEAALPEGYTAARRFATAVSYQSRVLVVGGRCAEQHESRDVVAYNHAGAGSWQRLPDLPIAVCHANAAVVRVPGLQGGLCSNAKLGRNPFRGAGG